ncbi:MAG: hypothetical protein M0R28_17845 [Pigmentiphaga sp.]|nr:hypothetical protein [Pigmentiphaga sp.]
MALTDAEKARIRYHLGYTNVNDTFALGFGVPQGNTFQRPLELHFDNVDRNAEPFVRQCIHELDCIEQQRSKFRESLEFESAGNVKFRGSAAFAELDVQYQQWQAKLGDILGSYPNPTSVANNLGSGGVVEPTGC